MRIMLSKKTTVLVMTAVMSLGLFNVTAASYQDGLNKRYEITENTNEGTNSNTIGKVTEANNWSEKNGEGIIVNDKAADFTSVGGSFKAGDYLKYDSVDFKNGEFNTMLMTISALNADNNKKIEVRLNSTDGQLLQTINIQASNDESAFKDHYISIPEVSGTHDIVLVFKDNMNVNLDRFVLSSYNGSESEEEFDQRMKWFRDGRFGQFIHFGPYAYAGGEYKGRTVQYSEWIMDMLRISKEDYAKDISKNFNPSEFNAQDFVDLAKEAGQTYMVFTTRHHDGFSMYDTQVRTFKDYSLMTYGDYEGQDPVAELSKACKEAGIKFGAYYTIYDWYDPTQSNYGNYINPDQKEEYKTRMKAQLTELITKYDVELLWFDGQWPNWWTKEDGREFYRYLRTLKPSLLINNRVGKWQQDDGDYGTPENEIPETGLDYDWESCMTLNKSWGYHKNDNDWKDAETVIYNLVDTASKGGNYLLNVGPDELGKIPQATVDIFKEVGEWIDLYGDSIYGTKIGCFTKLPNGIRSTVKDGKVYLHFDNWTSGDTIKIPKLKNEIYSMKVMGTDLAINYTELKDGLLLELPEYEGNQYSTVVEIDVNGMPEAEGAQANVNLAATAKEVIASNYHQNNSTYDGRKAVDGNKDTRWATDDNTHQATLELRFEEPITFTKASFKNFVYPNKNKIDAYNIEYWNGTEWIVGYEGGEIPETSEVTFAPITGDRIRLNITDSINPSIYEFQLFNEEIYDVEITGPSQTKILSSDGFTVQGTSQGGSKLDVTVLSTNSVPKTFEATVNADGTWSAEVSQIGEGVKTIRASLKDADGATVDVTSLQLNVRDFGKNLAEGKSVTVSSEYNKEPGYDKKMAVDGDLSTRWAPQNGDKTPTMTIDLGGRTTFNKVIISEMLDTWVNPNAYRCLKFKIEYKDNGQWKTAHEGTTIGKEKIIDFDPVTGDSIRFTIQENTPANNYAPANIVEFEVYNTAKETVDADFNNDGVINILDLSLASKYYNQEKSDYDLDGDGLVGEYEIKFIMDKILGIN